MFRSCVSFLFLLSQVTGITVDDQKTLALSLAVMKLPSQKLKKKKKNENHFSI